MGGERLTNDMLVAAGTIILDQDGKILLVEEKGRWGLPKGGQERGESLVETAIRETKEETGLDVKIKELAFITEFFMGSGTHYLQAFYSAIPIGGDLNDIDDEEVISADFFPLSELSERLAFVPRLVPLKQWLKERRPRYHVTHNF